MWKSQFNWTAEKSGFRFAVTIFGFKKDLSNFVINKLTQLIYKFKLIKRMGSKIIDERSL